MTRLEMDGQKMFHELLRYILNYIFQISALNARVGQRNRLNVFDVIKLVRLLHISPNELRGYMNWLQRESEFIKELFPLEFSAYDSNNQLDLSFGTDVNEIKKPGFDFLPPKSSSFTYKFTSVDNNLF